MKTILAAILICCLAAITFGQTGKTTDAEFKVQYFGYLRRDPAAPPDSDLSGYNFRLNKLNEFNGDFVQAEMVRSFIVSAEYRRRFGPEPLAPAPRR